MTKRGKKEKKETIAAGETSDFPAENDLQSASHIVVFCSLKSEQLHLHDSTETIHKMKKEKKEKRRERERENKLM